VAVRRFFVKAMRMSEGGRVVVPVEIRKALDLKDGDLVYWEFVDGEAKLTTKQARLRRSQAMVQQVCALEPGDSVVDELIAERRQESEQE
jgi:bifunctional DNA-binding transcriptional regulator/antitoxin component of YhaV-PrlF toxin-antitoxin module